MKNRSGCQAKIKYGKRAGKTCREKAVWFQSALKHLCVKHEPVRR